jgi:hypothetical protein
MNESGCAATETQCEECSAVGDERNVPFDWCKPAIQSTAWRLIEISFLFARWELLNPTAIPRSRGSLS